MHLIMHLFLLIAIRRCYLAEPAAYHGAYHGVQTALLSQQFLNRLLRVQNLSKRFGSSAAPASVQRPCIIQTNYFVFKPEAEHFKF